MTIINNTPLLIHRYLDGIAIPNAEYAVGDIGQINCIKDIMIFEGRIGR